MVGREQTDQSFVSMCSNFCFERHTARWKSCQLCRSFELDSERDNTVPIQMNSEGVKV
jgi:hypothetical protein